MIRPPRRLPHLPLNNSPLLVVPDPLELCPHLHLLIVRTTTALARAILPPGLSLALVEDSLSKAFSRDVLVLACSVID
jgi:hypothetical protein